MRAMRKGSEKQISPLLFLLLIGGFGWLAMTYVGENESNVKVAGKEEVAGEIAPTQALTPVYIDEDYEPIVIDFTNNSVEVSPEVLGAVSIPSLTCNGYSSDSEVPYQPICLTEDAGANFDDVVDGSSTKVSKNAVIKIAKITIPNVPAGSKYFETTRKEITRKFPSLVSAGTAVADMEGDYVSVRCFPGEENCLTGNKDWNFGISAETNFGGEGPSGEETPIEIAQDTNKLNNLLNPKDSLVNTNYANKGAERVAALFDLPVDPNAEPVNPLLGKCMTMPPGVKDFSDHSKTACFDVVNVVSGLISAIFNLDKQEECLAGDDSCDGTVPIVIMVGCLHGCGDSTNGYIEGASANRLFSLRRSVSRAPGAAAAIAREGSENAGPNVAYTQPLYFKTECAVTVDGKYTKVACLHDFSYIIESYERQRMATVINDDDNQDPDKMPNDFDEYLEYVVEEQMGSPGF